MSIFIISLIWNSELVPDLSQLKLLLDANFKWVQLTEDSFLIASDNTPTEIRNFLTGKLDSISRIFVGEMKQSAAWRNMIASSDKIKQVFNHQ